MEYLYCPECGAYLMAGSGNVLIASAAGNSRCNTSVAELRCKPITAREVLGEQHETID